MKHLLSICTSVVVSVAIVLGLIHSVGPASVDTSSLQAATYKMEGTMYSIFGTGTASCSGVLIDNHRYLTAGHCGSLSDVKVDGKPAKLIKIDVKNDIALFDVEQVCPCIPVGDEAQVGDKVVVVGFPFGQAKTVEEGKINGIVKIDLPESMEDSINPNGFLFTRILIEPGNSGGGMFKLGKDGKWYVVSVISLKADGYSISPSSQALKAFLG